MFNTFSYNNWTENVAEVKKEDKNKVRRKKQVKLKTDPNRKDGKPNTATMKIFSGEKVEATFEKAAKEKDQIGHR